MSQTATARLTGSVLRVEDRNGTARATGQPYSMTIVRVLVADTGLTEVVIPRSFPVSDIPRAGEEVDWLVEFSAATGPAGGGNGRLNINILGQFPVHAAA